jgi:hypothetical protein
MKDTPAEYQIESQQLLFAGNAYFNFINSLKSPNTKTTYIQCLKQYMQYRNVKTVDELLIGDQRLLQSNKRRYERYDNTKTLLIGISPFSLAT